MALESPIASVDSLGRWLASGLTGTIPAQAIMVYLNAAAHRESQDRRYRGRVEWDDDRDRHGTPPRRLYLRKRRPGAHGDAAQCAGR